MENLIKFIEELNQETKNSVLQETRNREILRIYAKSENVFERIAVASNFSTPKDLFDDFAFDNDSRLRLAVIKNEISPEGSIDRLVDIETNCENEIALAQRAVISKSILEKFLKTHASNKEACEIVQRRLSTYK